MKNNIVKINIICTIILLILTYLLLTSPKTQTSPIEKDQSSIQE